MIIIDEAGLANGKQGAEVLALAQKHRQRVVFVGDSRQHVSVEAGDFLRILETSLASWKAGSSRTSAARQRKTTAKQ